MLLILCTILFNTNKYIFKMSRSFLYWLLLGLWFIAGWWLCRKYLCGASDANPTSNVAAVAPIAAATDKCDVSMAITDGSDLNITSTRNVRFLKSSFNNLTNTTGTNSALQQTADYLVANSDRSLTITGKYGADETYDGILPNLGIARATTIKNLLTGMGAPANQLNVRGSEDETVCYSEDTRSGLGDAGGASASGSGGTDGAANSGGDGVRVRRDTLNNGVGFSFAALSNTDDRLTKIKDRLFGKPITLYFNKNADNLNLTAQQRQDFADLSYYLDQVASARLSVEGHTDSDGDETYNRRLSRSRAQTVQQYIVDRAGIANDRLTSQGFGERKPIESNETVEGKAKNRRVEVILR